LLLSIKKLSKKNFPRKTFSFSSQFFLESFSWKVFQVSFSSQFFKSVFYGKFFNGEGRNEKKDKWEKEKAKLFLFPIFATHRLTRKFQ
jgi:hypothetical protein